MQPPSYLQNLVSQPQHPNRPHVTLTFAQSLDAKIAGPAGVQLALSGPESMLITHWLRSMHDAILVGIATALNDDPQLNTRLLPPSDQPRHLPRPIILDSSLRLPPTCKLLKNYAAGTGRRPWIIATRLSLNADPETANSWNARSDALIAAGAKILCIERGPDNTLAALELLSAQGIRSLMVEGGARVIESFLRTENCVDTLIITTAPLLVGQQGVGYIVPSPSSRFRVSETRMEGKDTIVVFVAN
ncbi:Methionine aminopeptidase 2 [Mycena kentingensis (nom. inval.)]|nr:Methionine aminopeptidase 2 [Mycena kentingensis (nom. inval.)]